ncbi:MAG TPA: hypothetical protein PKD78_14450, partial [Saprospiraceae bacterium]|nr:hypothetical protein [Saprospiraceae bacterium]
MKRLLLLLLLLPLFSGCRHESQRWDFVLMLDFQPPPLASQGLFNQSPLYRIVLTDMEGNLSSDMEAHLKEGENQL